MKKDQCLILHQIQSNFLEDEFRDENSYYIQKSLYKLHLFHLDFYLQLLIHWQELLGDLICLLSVLKFQLVLWKYRSWEQEMPQLIFVLQ